MLHEVENAGLHIAKLSGAVFAVNQLPDFLGVGTDPNIITRSLKKGFLLYLANETVEMATLGNSNFNRMDTLDGWKTLVDDTVFYGTGQAFDETMGVSKTLKSAIPANSIPDSVTDSVIIGSVLYATKYVGSKLENSVIKRVSHFFM